jgi:hypothetical protein
MLELQLGVSETALGLGYFADIFDESDENSPTV